jgi:hypothetical protein
MIMTSALYLDVIRRSLTNVVFMLPVELLDEFFCPRPSSVMNQNSFDAESNERIRSCTGHASGTNDEPCRPSSDSIDRR